VAEPDMSDLHEHGGPARQDHFVAPVELIAPKVGGAAIVCAKTHGRSTKIQGPTEQFFVSYAGVMIDIAGSIS